MNDNVIHELELLVEQSVRPVRAPFVSKKRMREDLFSHLTATYEDEFAKSHDESNALQQTRERFGDPAEVGRELQLSVPAHHIFSYWFESRLARQPGESFLHLAGKHLLAGFLYFCLLAVIGLTFQLHKKDGGPGAMLWLFADLILVMTLMCTLLEWLTDQMGRAMLSSDPQMRRRRWRYGLLSMLVFPGLLGVVYLGLGFWFGPDALLPMPNMYLPVLLLALLTPAIPLLLGPITARRTLYLEKWAALELPVE